MNLIMTVLNWCCGLFSVLFAKQLYLQHDLDAKKKSAGGYLVPELFCFSLAT